MKARLDISRPTPWIGLALVLLGAPFRTPAAPAKPAAPTAVRTNTASALEVPKSVFVVPTSPKEGRNPFFPLSSMGYQAPKPKENQIDPSAFVLNGITSPPKRTAMINGRTFEVGEEGEVRGQGGTKVLIRCLEIRTDSAVISAGGQRRELHFRSGL
ncbi:MAG TPA: hypothetical protein VNT26_20155 [Candidatus Sulfotelmatobacter sp.]|nr:hypothetical protein [Candidatus Sulfotelmatobacter sp.]HWI56897.1 hypothetical protein [Bacillota bacterium]